MSTLSRSTTVSIIGTGDFARGLALRLLKCGHKVNAGSRHPERVQLAMLQDAIQASEVIFLAIPSSAHATFAKHDAILEGKIVVDVSNTDKPKKNWSVAEELANLLPKSNIVKGVNTIPAYSLHLELNNGNRDV